MTNAANAAGQGAESDPLFEAMRQVNAGRKLVIYERTTGLFAHWYIALRCEEECYRAQRYGRQLSIGVIEPREGSDAWVVAEKIAPALQERLRRADLPGYLGNARFILAMPETTLTQGLDVLRRIADDIPEVQNGVAAFPEDGLTFDQLYEIAVRRLQTGESGSPSDKPPTSFRRVDRPGWA
jgi:hypothetical protein